MKCCPFFVFLKISTIYFGLDEDFVKILSIYKGYFVEFTMTPNPNAASKTLTDDQIQTAIQFLTDVMFEPMQH